MTDVIDGDDRYSLEKRDRGLFISVHAEPEVKRTVPAVRRSWSGSWPRARPVR